MRGRTEQVRKEDGIPGKGHLGILAQGNYYRVYGRFRDTGKENGNSYNGLCGGYGLIQFHP